MIETLRSDRWNRRTSLCNSGSQDNIFRKTNVFSLQNYGQRSTYTWQEHGPAQSSTFLPHFQVILFAQQRLKRTMFDIVCYLGLYSQNKVSSRVHFKVSILGWNGSKEEGWQWREECLKTVQFCFTNKTRMPLTNSGFWVPGPSQEFAGSTSLPSSGAGYKAQLFP